MTATTRPAKRAPSPAACADPRGAPDARGERQPAGCAPAQRGRAGTLVRISHIHGRRKGSTRRGTTAGTAWNAGLRPAQPAEGGRREGLPVPRWRRPGGNLSILRGPSWEWQTPLVTVRAMCLRSVKADGKEPPAALGVVVSSPTGKNPRRRRLYAISSVGGRCRDGSHPGDLGSLPPRPCGPLCRPEAGPVLPVGAPSRPRHGAIGSTRSRAHPRCRRPVAAALHGNRWEVDVPYPTPRHGDQRPRFMRSRHPRQQVAPPWGALRAVSMRNTGYE